VQAYSAVGIHPELGCRVFEELQPQLRQVYWVGQFNNALNMQHLCSKDTNCWVKYSQKAWRVERQDVVGKFWEHGDGGQFILNRFRLGG